MEQNIITKLAFGAMLALMCNLTSAQENYYINSHWWLQLPLINPAASGMNHDIDAGAGSRLGSDYNEIGDGTLLYGRVDGKIHAINSGIGFSYFNNNPEAFSNQTDNYSMRQRFLLNYNYQLEFENSATLAFGASIEIIYNSWNIRWTPIIPGSTIPPPSGNSTDISLGFGAMYSSNRWHLGFSILPAAILKDEPNLVYPENAYYLTGSYDFSLAEKFSIEPGVLLHFIKGGSNINLNLKAWYNRMYYAGLGINRNERYPDSLDMLLGLRLENGLSFQYAYVYVLSEFSSINPNKNVISINYQLPNK